MRDTATTVRRKGCVLPKVTRGLWEWRDRHHRGLLQRQAQRLLPAQPAAVSCACDRQGQCRYYYYYALQSNNVYYTLQ